MPTYRELKEKHQAEVNELPIYWAFGDKQWRDLLEKLGMTEEQAKTELVVMLGGIVRKCDAKHILDTLARHRQEMQEAMKDLEFFKSAVLYEMRNHEYGINMQADWDVINALGFNVKYSDGNELIDCKMTEEQKKVYLKARREYFRLADEKEWF